MTIAANIGDVAVLNFDASFPDSIVGFIPNTGIRRDFLYFVFTAMRNELLQEAPVSTQGNLNVERIGAKSILVPPVSEQDSICRCIQEITAKLSLATNTAKREIDLLREYRTRLTTDVVTGKLDIREAASALPKSLALPNAEGHDSESEYSD